jgi:O-antigen/teichoic acid export membrane protein
MSIGVRVIRNSVFSFVASIVTKVVNTLVFILIARRLTVNDVGVYSLALTYSIIFVQIASWGLDQLLIREVARHREEAGRYLVNFALMRLLFSLLVYILLALIVVLVIRYERVTACVLLLVGVTIVFDSVSNICQAVFIAFERLVYITYGSLVMSLFKLGATWAGLRGTGGLTLLAGIIVGASLAGMLFNLGAVWRRFVGEELSENRAGKQIDLSAWPIWLYQAFPFTFVVLFYTLDYQLDVVLLSVWRGEEAVGLYGAATTVLFVLLFIPQAFREATFPIMSRLYSSNPKALRQLYSASARWLLAIALPIALGTTLIADDLMPLLYKEAFRESGRVLQITIWSILFLFLNVPNGRLMIVAGKQREVAWFAIISMSTNLLLNVILIPSQSYIGTALARLASAALFFSLIYIYTYRHLMRFNLLTILPRPAIAAAVMGVVVEISTSLPLLVVIAMGATSYVLTLWLVGFLSGDERAIIRQVISQMGQWGVRRWVG